MSILLSFPLWGRGLKFDSLCYFLKRHIVVPLAGTWIKIRWRCLMNRLFFGLTIVSLLVLMISGIAFLITGIYHPIAGLSLLLYMVSLAAYQKTRR